MRKSVWLLSAGLIALSHPAFAQETDTDQGSAEPTSQPTEGAAVDDDALEQQPVDTSDIVITATRRNEALSDVPLAVSAVTAETLENSGATDIRQLQQVSPSLLVSSTSSEAGATVARIRGVGTVGDNPGLESSVAVFIDGVYRSRTSVGLTELGALDRVEVLRGPQGTLFGRNASAGIISIHTAKPRFQNMIAAELTIGNFDLRRIEASVTGPITDTLAFRADAVYLNRDGFLEDVISGRSVNDRNRVLVRVQGLYEPTDDLSVRLIADATDRREECCAAPFLPARDFVRNADGSVSEAPSTIAALERALGGVINDDPFDRDVSITPNRSFNSDVDDYGFSGEVVYDLGGAELTSITAYRYNNYVRGLDADFNNLDIWYRDGSGGSENRFQTFSQEARVQGEAMGGRLDWLLGGYFAREKLRVLDNLTYGADATRYGNCLIFTSALPAAVNPASPTCINQAVVTGAQQQVAAGTAQINAGLVQINAGIAALQAIPNPTPAQQAQLAGLIAQRTALQTQLAGLQGTAGLLGAVNAVPGAPGLSSIAAALGLGTGYTLNGVGLNDEYNQTSNNFALFTHNIFEITDGLNLTVGLRYTREKKRLNVELADNNTLCRAIAASPLSALQQYPCAIPATATGTFSDSGSKSENKLSGTAVLSFKPSDEWLTYMSYSRGYKAGGFNLDRSALPRSGASRNGAILPTARVDDLQFDPEINDAIELGAKYNGRGLDVNVALFQQLYDDFQLNLFNGVAFEVETVNSCADELDGSDTDNDQTPPFTGACTGKVRHGVRSRGLEFELFARPHPYLNLNFGGTFVSTRYRNRLVGSDGEGTSGQLFQLPGRRISNSASLTMTSSAAFTPPIGGSGMTGLLYVDMRRMTRYNTGSDLDIEKVQDPFTVFNGRIGIRGPNQAWAIELWGQNLFDEDFIQVGFDAPLQGSGTYRGVEQGLANGFYDRSNQLFGAFLGEPRTYGMTLRGKFGPSRAPVAAYVAPPAPPPPPVATQTCPDGSIVDAGAVCPVPPPPPPPPPGERG